jgi:hypothetical protein
MDADRRAPAQENVVMLRNRGELDGLQKRPFVEGVSWPVERASLDALSDLGLTVKQIARYFSVDPSEVRALQKSAQ